MHALRSPRGLAAAAAALVLLLVSQTPPMPAQAQSGAAGTLDVSFGGDGKATSSVIRIGNSRINALAVQSDGKIIAAGSATIGSDLDFTLIRYTADGAVDTTFGTNGMVTTDFNQADDTIYGVEVLSDGKILVAGYAHDGSNTNFAFDFALARYTAAGALDTTFGTNGKVTTALGSGADEIRAMALQSDGDILVAGNSDNGTNRDFALARYTANGALDTTFGTVVSGQTRTGYVVTPIGSSDDYGSSVAVHTDGTIVVGGYTKISGNNYDFALARYTNVGALDTSFDSDGKVTTTIGSSDDRIHGVAVLSDGKVLAGGYSSHGSPRWNDFTLARYTAAGTLDTTFGEGSGQTKSGYVTSMRNRGDAGLAMLLQSDGTVLMGGYIYRGTGDDYDFTVARFTAAGALDTTFGEGSGQTKTGHVTTSISTLNEEAYALALQSDGKILLGGFSDNGPYNNMAMTRYTAAGALDTSFGDSGKVVTIAARGHSYGAGVALQSDGKLVMIGDGYNGSTNQNDFLLTRFNADGTVDRGFGDDGVVTTDFQSGASDYGAVVAVQSDGKIVVAGRSYGTARDFALARYSDAGVLDTTFGSGGKVTTDFSSGEDRPYAMALQSDGKIVVVGYAHNGSDNDWAIARYTNTGILDTTFDGDGKVVTALGSGNDRARAVAVQSDGKIVVGGGIGGDFAVARYTAAGALDTTFGGDANGDNTPDGYVTTTMSSGDDTALAVALQEDGKIVAAGAAIISGDYDFAVARYTAAGALDTSFGTVSGQTRTGYVTTPMSDHRDIAYGLLLQSGGRIVVTGWAGATAGDVNRPLDFALVRYTSDGDLDTDFGTGGKVTTPIGPGDDRAFGAVLQPDGKVVLAGYAHSGSGYEFALARYHAPTANTVSLSVSPNPVDEGNSVTVTVRLSAALEGRVTIPLTLRDGTAESSDYGSIRSIAIEAGETSGTGVITTAQDADTEDETFTVSLGAVPSPLERGSPDSVTVTIVDDDYPDRVTLTASSTRPSEGSRVTLTARLNMGAPTGGVRVRFFVNGGTAVAGLVDDVDDTTHLIDYTLEPESTDAGLTGYIDLSPGQTVARGAVNVVNDTDAEGAETIELSVIVSVSSWGLTLIDQITLTIPANDGGVRPPPTDTPTPTPPTTTTTGGGFGGGPVTTPSFDDGGQTSRSVVAITTEAGGAIGDPVTASHPDGQSITYSVVRASADLFTVDEETGQIRLKEGAKLEVGVTYTITLRAQAESGASAFITVAVEVTHHPYDRDSSGELERDEVLTAVRDYFEEELTLEEVLAIVRLYFSS